MLSYIARRLASTVLVMGIVAVFVFLLLHLSPGDPAAIIAGDNASGEQIAGIRRQLGLDDPLPVQFFRWLTAVLQGDLGISIFSNEPVLKLIPPSRPPTIAGSGGTCAGSASRTGPERSLPPLPGRCRGHESTGLRALARFGLAVMPDTGNRPALRCNIVGSSVPDMLAMRAPIHRNGSAHSGSKSRRARPGQRPPARSGKKTAQGQENTSRKVIP